MKLFYVFVGGLIFGFGLAFSGAAIPEVVLSFLQLKDFGLLLILAVAILVTMLTYQLVPKLMKKPLSGKEFKTKKSPLNKQTVAGAAIFGVGWGLSGLCPGTVLAGVGMGNYPLLVGIAAMFLGTYVNGLFRK
ncbi:YeeE/YedE family protein [Candidatus Woesearchaeota archaeon]|nr:YeeE/YedE family protein [Candidatus Woesearchaeota archaeon]